MERRFAVFLVLSCIILYLCMPKPKPKPKPPVDGQAREAVVDDVEDGDDDADDGGEAADPEDAADDVAQDPEQQPLEQDEDAATAEIGPQWATLGSANPEDPYRMLVTLTNRGAAVKRIELNSPRYHELNERWGYLGNLVTDEADDGNGSLVKVVGPGTPADVAGLQAGDVIVGLDIDPANDPANGNDQSKLEITSPDDLLDALEKTKPNRKIGLDIVRDGQKKTLSVKLGWRPLEVVKPENDDPLSFLMTLHQIGKDKLENQMKSKDIALELEGVDLRDGLWEVLPGDRQHVTFRKTLPDLGIEVRKTYRLAKVPTEKIADANYKAYHLDFELRVRNIGGKTRRLAYQLDGPTGLPDEGWWYANKISHSWGGIGLRDVVVSRNGGDLEQIGCPTIADDEFGAPQKNASVGLVGVDAQYFSAVMIPQDKEGTPEKVEFAQWEAMRVGEVNEERKSRTDVSFRLVGESEELSPGKSITQRFRIFAGPKKPEIIAQYGLGDLVYYGWFGVIAKPLGQILHFFYSIVGNYGLAIILLTVLVRLSMFPLSKKQVLGAQKMQELQPEIKKIQAKYKKDMEARTKAQQDLFRKHNYNPLSGCLVLFIQLPIFIALYRSLMVDIELRQAPLLWEGIRWCSNLSAPDMLYAWTWMPDWVQNGSGVFGLGPYFNILPIFTVVLFVLQQKMFMPPPTDEQSAMQQKIMKYMMIFIGFMFFKVASGLCIYFIASSLWGLAERKFLPKPVAKPVSTETPTRADAKARQRREDAENRRDPSSKKVKKGRGRK